MIFFLDMGHTITLFYLLQAHLTLSLKLTVRRILLFQLPTWELILGLEMLDISYK